MPLASKKIQDIILPIGFAIIIFLMISTAFLTTKRIDTTNKTVQTIQTQTNHISRLLSAMSTSVFNRSLILFRMFQSNDPFVVDELIMELHGEATRFTVAREEFVSFDLSDEKEELLLIQSNMSKHNAEAINRLSDYLIEENYAEASMLMNDRVLPLMKHILETIDKLQKEAQNTASNKVIESKKISNDQIDSILFFHITSILISFLLMMYLIRKQRQSNNDLSYLANTDTLTDLSNRDNFIQHINQTLKLEGNSKFAIIFFDVDYFKSINDIYGHEVGDKVLKLFSKTIKQLITRNDVLARFGGDEFVLLLRNQKSIDSVKSLVKNVSKQLDTSFIIDNNEIYVSASIGASFYPEDGQTAKELLKNADIAMYTAKQSGRNCYQFYSIENSQKQEHEHNLSHALQTILKNKNSNNELSLVYQPLVNISNEEFDECEALIRWKDENGNAVNTAEFIEIAEKSNLIQKVNMFVIEEACKQQDYWQKNGIPNIRIHINLSGNKRIFSELFKFFSENLYKYNLSPTLFGIELTERTIYDASEETNQDLEHFRELGMKISIDDFGTGYSSLSYLKDLPITSVKIDQSFIQGVPDEKVDVALVKAIITLAHSLDFDVVAEGVETAEQLAFLKSYDCNIAQGYLLHRPLSSDDISKLKLVA